MCPTNAPETKSMSVRPLNERRKHLSKVKEDRMVKVAEMDLAGWTTHEIAEKLGCAMKTVYRDRETIYARWREASITHFDQRIAIEIAKIDSIEKMARKAFDESQEPEVITNARTRQFGDEEIRVAGRALRGVSIKVRDEIGQEREIIKRPGDARFLKIMLDCADRRMRILKIPHLEALLSIQAVQTDDEASKQGKEADGRGRGIDRLADTIRAIAGTIGIEPVAGQAGSIPRAEPRTPVPVPRDGTETVAG